ncbi:IS5 family transposase [Rhodococcus erythropolis]
MLPPPGNSAGRDGRPEEHCRRMILAAIFYLVRGGIAWRQLPAEYPPPMTVYAVFARWVRGGAWQRMHDTLRDRTRTQEGRGRCPTAAVIDSQTVPAADTVPRSSRGWDGAKRTNGRKRHIAVDVNGLLLGVVVTATSIQDRDAAQWLLAALRVAFSTIGLVWADGGYPVGYSSGRNMFSPCEFRSSNANQAVPDSTSAPTSGWPSGSFAWICKHRRCVRDYETRPDHHEAMVRIAMIVLMTRRLART